MFGASFFGVDHFGVNYFGPEENIVSPPATGGMLLLSTMNGGGF